METNLFLVTSRYYSLELGRFIQPVDVSSLNPQSINGLNLYTYANNNPIGIADRSSSTGGSTSGGIISSITSNVGCSNSGYYGTIPNSSNIFGVLGSLLNAFGFFDKWSGYLSGGLVAIGIGFAGAVAIYYLGEWIDDGWERFKKQIFE